MKIKKTKAQIWVETVVYTLIGLSIITIILVTIVPRIETMKDKALVEQTISSINDINSKILELEQASSGNARVVNFRMSKGKLEIDSVNDSITYVLENTKLEMSGPGAEIEQGSIIIKTEPMGSKFKVSLISRYENIDITYEDEEQNKILHAGATPYKIVIENTGIVTGDKKNIDLNVG